MRKIPFWEAGEAILCNFSDKVLLEPLHHFLSGAEDYILVMGSANLFGDHIWRDNIARGVVEV